jgi:hypothetical protein
MNLKKIQCPGNKSNQLQCQCFETISTNLRICFHTTYVTISIFWIAPFCVAEALTRIPHDCYCFSHKAMTRTLLGWRWQGKFERANMESGNKARFEIKRRRGSRVCPRPVCSQILTRARAGERRAEERGVANGPTRMRCLSGLELHFMRRSSSCIRSRDGTSSRFGDAIAAASYSSGVGSGWCGVTPAVLTDE